MATAVEKITMFFGIVTAALALTTIGAAQNETTKIDPLVGATAELQHTIERAFVLADGNSQIRPEDLIMPRESV